MIGQGSRGRTASRKPRGRAGVLALVASAFVLFGALGAVSAAVARPFANLACETPPPAFCAPTGCPQGFLDNLGNALEAKTGRRFFLDFPCDLKPGEKVVFILNLHGHGSSGAWVRNYFPATSLVSKYRLVVATPTAGNTQHDWAEADNAHLQNIADQVIGEFGPQNIKAFWLAGHSLGGAYANRIVCNDYFKGRVDGWLSLSGGRIGKIQPSPDIFRSTPVKAGSTPAPVKIPPGAGGVDTPPACDFNFIFETGDQEIVGLPSSSPWAEKYGCAARTRERDVVDTRPGLIDHVREGEPNPALGRKARPGVAQVMLYPKCRDGRVVADVVRLDKGHTEGLEPKITERLVAMMAGAPGGKLRSR